jgi:hypothetical protein
VKPRTVVTYKLLSIAVTACTTQVSAPDREKREEGPPPQEAARDARSDKEVRPELLALRAELDQAGRASALARPEHFRPLCDADGYPLVGNLQRKREVGREYFGPTAFCAAMREKKATRS